MDYDFLGSQVNKYTSWLVIVTLYNLPPLLCMKEFITIIVSRPKCPKYMLNVYLQPPIVGLKHLRELRVDI